MNKNMFINDIIFFFPQFFLGLCILFSLIYVVFFNFSHYNSNEIQKFIFFVSRLSIYFLFITFVLVVIQPHVNVEIFTAAFTFNFSKQIFSCLILFFSSIILVLLPNYFFYEKIFKPEFVIVLLFSVLGMLLVIGSNDFILLYLSLEFQSFSFYILAASKVKDRKSTEAGLKYFILGSFSSGLLLFGITIIYNFTGLTNFSDLYRFLFFYHNISFLFSIVLGFIFILLGIFFKFPAAPFHSWAPDVYQGSPTIILAFFAIVPKISAVYLLTNLTYFVFPFFLQFSSQFLCFSAFFSVFIGSLGAFFQINIKRLLAYSTITHVGFIFFALSTASFYGLQVAYFYLFVYLLISINFFVVLVFARFSNFKRVETFSDLIHFSNFYKIFGVITAISFFSMAGIPPLAGFFSKYLVLSSLINAKMYFFAIFLLFITIVSCFYYIRIVRFIYFDFVTNKFIFPFAFTSFVFNFLLFITVINVFFVFVFDTLFQYSNIIAFNIVL